MSSKSKQTSKDDNPAASKDDTQTRLPFEPASVRKKTAKKTSPADKAKDNSATSSASKQEMVPKVVSRRMARRMAAFCGVPTGLGMLTFVVSYIVVTNHWLKLPNVAVLLVSLGCFGLGVLGLSYGALSASWDENQVGSLIGWPEFTANFGRMRASWREAGQNANSGKS